MKHASRIIYILAGMAAIVSFAYATGLEIASGTKSFQLNSKVAAPHLEFVSKAPLEDIKGTVGADKVNSWVSMDVSNLENTKGKISFRVDGMETGITTRDGHLAGKEWLDAEAYPEITFDLKKLSNIRVDNSNKSKGRATIFANAVGSVTIRGKSKDMNVPVTINYIKESEETKKRAQGDFLSVEGKMDVTLKDFDVNGTKGTVGSRVGEVINTSFRLFYNSK